MGTPKKYHLLYLPTGAMVEILGPVPALPEQRIIYADKVEWRKLSKSRQDLKKVLIRVLAGNFPISFYQHNEMLKPPALKSCHFVFQKVSKLLGETNDQTIKA
jgi:hypothetical protein